MDMHPNIGKWDARFRYTIGIILLMLVALVESNWRWLGLIGIVPIVTAAIYWCPVWHLFHINTRERGGHGPASHAQ